MRALHAATLNPEGRYVLYWMVAARRLAWNHALDRAEAYARALGLPLVILEALRADYPWASLRHHRFALDGMAEHAAALEDTPVTYHPYVEPAPGAGRGLLEAWAREAAVVVTDDYPSFFLPRMLQAAGARCPVAMEAVDGNGLVPMALPPKAFTAAYHFRRWLQRSLPEFLGGAPRETELALRPGLRPGPEIPEAIARRWPVAPRDLLERRTDAALPAGLDTRAGPVAGAQGGTGPASVRLDAFIRRDLARYADARNHPDDDAGSGLSPYLHWGHLSVHEVFHRIAGYEGWTPLRLSPDAAGRREGWWGMRPGAEAFLDQLVTWRELGFNQCVHNPAYDRYDTLPAWARQTLEDHAADPRPHLYGRAAFEEARTHDPLWNAAQRQLLEEGVIHNYLRMLWGKKILEWSAHPREALDIMVELNNRWALDGRDPNSYAGIMWVLGRFDRGWPRRPVFGKVRSMSSDATRRKVRVTEYLRRFGDP